MGFVYLLLGVDDNGEEKFKIGTTRRTVDERIGELQTGNSSVISYLKTYESIHYKMIERMLHKRFVSQKTVSKNEWFSLSN